MNEAPLRSHVLRSLRRDLCTAPLLPDDRGDVTLPVGEVPVVVRLVPGAPPLVQVSSAAAHGLPSTARVLREVNDVNAGLVGARAFLLQDGTLHVVGELEVVSVEGGELGRLVLRVGTTATRVGSLLVAVHGGRLPAVREEEPAREG